MGPHLLLQLNMDDNEKAVDTIHENVLTTKKKKNVSYNSFFPFYIILCTSSIFDVRGVVSGVSVLSIIE